MSGLSDSAAIKGFGKVCRNGHLVCAECAAVRQLLPNADDDVQVIEPTATTTYQLTTWSIVSRSACQSARTSTLHSARRPGTVRLSVGLRRFAESSRAGKRPSSSGMRKSLGALSGELVQSALAQQPDVSRFGSCGNVASGSWRIAAFVTNILIVNCVVATG